MYTIKNICLFHYVLTSFCKVRQIVLASNKVVWTPHRCSWRSAAPLGCSPRVAAAEHRTEPQSLVVCNLDNAHASKWYIV